MRVPKTAVDEHGEAQARDGEVGSTGEPGRIGRIFDAETVEEAAQFELRPGIARPASGHNPGTGRAHERRLKVHG